MHLSKYGLSFKYHRTPTSFRKPLIASVHMGLSWILLWVRPSARHWGHRRWVRWSCFDKPYLPWQVVMSPKTKTLSPLQPLPSCQGLIRGTHAARFVRWVVCVLRPQSLRLGMLGQRLVEQLQEQPHRGAVSDWGSLSAGQPE